jgi:hypothetical protein
VAAAQQAGYEKALVSRLTLKPGKVKYKLLPVCQEKKKIKKNLTKVFGIGFLKEIILYLL